jgi:hypothetical protein
MGLSQTEMALDGGMLTDASGWESDALALTTSRVAAAGALSSRKVDRHWGVEEKANVGWFGVNLRLFDMLTMPMLLCVL